MVAVTVVVVVLLLYSILACHTFHLDSIFGYCVPYFLDVICQVIDTECVIQGLLNGKLGFPWDIHTVLGDENWRVGISLQNNVRITASMSENSQTVVADYYRPSPNYSAGFAWLGSMDSNTNVLLFAVICCHMLIIIINTFCSPNLISFSFPKAPHKAMKIQQQDLYRYSNQW